MQRNDAMAALVLGIARKPIGERSELEVSEHTAILHTQAVQLDRQRVNLGMIVCAAIQYVQAVQDPSPCSLMQP